MTCSDHMGVIKTNMLQHKTQLRLPQQFHSVNHHIDERDPWRCAHLGISIYMTWTNRQHAHRSFHCNSEKHMNESHCGKLHSCQKLNKQRIAKFRTLTVCIPVNLWKSLSNMPTYMFPVNWTVYSTHTPVIRPTSKTCSDTIHKLVSCTREKREIERENKIIRRNRELIEFHDVDKIVRVCVRQHRILTVSKIRIRAHTPKYFRMHPLSIDFHRPCRTTNRAPEMMDRIQIAKFPLDSPCSRGELSPSRNPMFLIAVIYTLQTAATADKKRKTIRTRWWNWNFRF